MRSRWGNFVKTRFAYSLIALALAQHQSVIAAETVLDKDASEQSLSTTNSSATSSVATQSESTEQVTLVAPERIAVHGRAMQMYVDKETTIGTKTAINVMELPQSVQVLTEQLIIDQAARNITDLYRSIAGVSEFSYSGVTFRGFRDDANVFYDGVRGDPYSGFSVPQLFNVQRVEVLKGPASALYGGGEPGGMINYVTKKPTFVESKELTLSAGSEDMMGGSLDLTGGLTKNLAYRFGAYYQQEDSFRNNADSQNAEVAGGLLYEISDDTKLTTTFDIIKQDLGGNRLRGVPTDDDGNFLVDPSYNTNEKSDFQKMDALVLQSILDHQFTDNFSIKTQVRYLNNESDQQYHESRGWVDVNGDGSADVLDGTIKREYRVQSRANDEISLTNDFVYAFDALGFEHEFLFGGDYHYVETEYHYKLATDKTGVGNLNIFDLNYGETDPSSYNLTDKDTDGVRAKRYGVYVQEHLHFNEQWSIIAGLRFSQFDDYDKKTGFSFSDNAITPRAGLNYRPIDSMSFYLNYSESFKPASLTNQAENIGDGFLDPETGNQIELGMKNEWLDGQFMTTLALYRIEKQNVAQANPLDTGDDDGIPNLLNLGEVRSQGVEWTLVGDLTDNLTVTANYAYNETEVIKGVTNDSLTNTFDSKHFANAPRHQAGLWTRYDIDALDSAIAFGMDYVGEQFSLEGQTVKPHTIFDMSWTTQWDQTQVRLNLKNIFDKEYAVSGFTKHNGHFPGEPRNITLELSHKF
ncbi:TonB-dependent receptor [Shewanella profunda]|uniref:TonB-dependent siderophore receptor n=1 Tax=Shewanella profunda TaxID=254793 RepID=UPI00201004C1|nr:TonB-dependent receptor [Shewanella profunda]MCL1089538.1 TonB-dependent receptor [Shewanella profunda]